MTTDRQTDLSKQRIERTHATRDMSGRDHFVLLVLSNIQHTEYKAVHTYDRPQLDNK